MVGGGHRFGGAGRGGLPAVPGDGVAVVGVVHRDDWLPRGAEPVGWDGRADDEEAVGFEEVGGEADAGDGAEGSVYTDSGIERFFNLIHHALCAPPDGLPVGL